MKKNTLIIIITLLFVCGVYAYPQELLLEESTLEYTWGAVIQLEDVYHYDDLLYIIGPTYSYDAYPSFYAVSIYDISDPIHPEEVGRQVQDTYAGNPAYQNTIFYHSNTELHSPYYSIFDAENQPLHNFWQPNKCVQINERVFEFQDWKQTVSIYENGSSADFTFVREDSLDLQIREITGIEVIGSTIYITNRGTGLIILDVSHPDSLIEIENDFYGEDLTGIIVGDNKAVLGNDFRFVELLDISDPKNPSQVTTDNFFHQRFSGYWKNEQFYVSTYTRNVQILDEDINQVNVIQTEGYILDFIFKDTNLIVLSNVGIEIYDISNENAPDLLTLYGANNASPINFDKNNDLLFIVNLGDGIKIVDVSDSSAPVSKGNYDLNGYSLDVVVQNDFAYIADYILGLLIIDISNPDVLEIISTVPIDGASALDIKDDMVFLINDENVLSVINVSNKSEPQIEFTRSFENDVDNYYGRYKDILVAGGSIWIKLSWGPLLAFEYSTETGLTEVFNYEYDYASEPYEFQWYDPFLFITHANGSQIIDPYTNSFIREEVFGSRHMEESPHSVAADIDNNILYISLGVLGTSGIVAYDITDPQEPEILPGYLPLGFASEEMIFDDGLLYVLTPSGIALYSPSSISLVDERATQYSYQLQQNHPNPFNPTTTITYTLAEPSSVILSVYNIAGQKIATLVDKVQDPGQYQAVFDGSDLTSGLYFARLQSEGMVATQKMMLVK